VILDESDHENSLNGSDVTDGQKIDEDYDSLYPKPSSGVSESNTLTPLSLSGIFTVEENTAEDNFDSVFLNNN
jgi:hypothetical protein